MKQRCDFFILYLEDIVILICLDYFVGKYFDYGEFSIYSPFIDLQAFEKLIFVDIDIFFRVGDRIGYKRTQIDYVCTDVGLSLGLEMMYIDL